MRSDTQVAGLQWNSVLGLGFEIKGAPSAINVLLPEEQASIWLDAFGPPPIWAATTKGGIAEARKSSSMPSPAYFVHIASDDKCSVGSHTKYSEKVPPPYV